MSLPKYAEYKHSGVPWIGTIPSEWQVTPLLGIARERYESNHGMKEANLLSLSYGRIVQKDMASNDGLLPESFETYQIVRPGDVVFRLTDLQNDKRSLRTAPVLEVGIITSAYLAIEPQDIDSGYFSHLLRSYDLSKVFYSMGGGLRQSMKYDDVKRLPVLVPTVAEQRSIASFLARETAKIDALIAEQEKLLALLAEKRQATISHAVTRGLNPNVPMKDSGIPWLGDVPAHWDMLTLKRDLAFLTSGSRGWAEHYADQGALFLRIGNLTRDRVELDLGDIQRVAPPVGSEGERTKVEPGDVLFSITAYLGSVAVVPERLEAAYVSQHVALARLQGSRLLPKWVAYATLSRVGATYLATQGYGGTKVQLSLDDIACLPITAPPLEEQQRTIDVVESELEKLERVRLRSVTAVGLLRERRNALVTAAVTGQIDVRDYVSQGCAA
ncbi:restriction endonuclease subunit S [Lysobacter sp. HA18]